jgi:hypothetical protein
VTTHNGAPRKTVKAGIRVGVVELIDATETAQRWRQIIDAEGESD